MTKGEWLVGAEWIDVDLELNDGFALSHTKKILALCNFKYKRDLAEDALSCILANLIVNSYDNTPTIIPANDRDCKIIKDIAGIDWFVLERITIVLDALERLGYIGHAIGYRNERTSALSKYWLLDDTPFTSLVDKYKGSPIVYRSVSGRGFIIKDENKVKLDWTKLPKTNKKSITKMNASVNMNNRYMNKQVLAFDVSSNDIIESGKSIAQIILNMTNNVNTNRIILNIDTNRIKLIEKRTIDEIQYILLTTDEYYYIISNKITITKTGMKWNTKLGRRVECKSYEMSNSDIDIKRYNIVDKLVDKLVIDRSVKGITKPYKGELWGFDSAKQLIAFHSMAITPISQFAFSLSGIINDKTQIRIFNDSSFKKGGRLYWGPWNQMPKVIRRSFTFNGEPADRVDFVGLHLRMCYHELGKQFLGEPYIYAKGVNDRERGYMKLAGLIVFNADSVREAIDALFHKLLKKGFTGDRDKAKSIIEEFELYHEAISEKFYHKDTGKKLQYKDSTIMMAILTKLRKMKIPTISVHDEVIAPVKFKDVVKEVMLNEYKKEMKFETNVS